VDEKTSRPASHEPNLLEGEKAEHAQTNPDDEYPDGGLRAWLVVLSVCAPAVWMLSKKSDWIILVS
jgi:hypothetical protein